METIETKDPLEGVAPDVVSLLKDKEKLLRKKPFTRGGTIRKRNKKKDVPVGGNVTAQLSGIRRKVVTQDDFMAELDPYMHDVLFDNNIPSICVKTAENGAYDIKFAKMAFPFQRIIMEKQTLHLSCLPMKFTLSDQKPTDKMQQNFVKFKHYWDLRNQDGMKVKMVATAKSYGEAGLLFYMDRYGQIKSRLISYEDGYVICSHNDDNGDRILETVYYCDEDGNEVIDCWDDTYFYRVTDDGSGNPHIEREVHGFPEIPLVTKRVPVAWNNGQTEIEAYERAANIDNVIDNKWGWGLLYVKGRIDPNAKKIAGNIVLNDVSVDPSKSDAKFLDPPAAKSINEKFEHRFKQIEIATGTTFILPTDIHTSSDTSGVAVKMTQSLDIQTAENGMVEWQNVADKMVRLFKYGLAMELVNKDKTDPDYTPDAITEFSKMNINANFDIWTPYSEVEYNTMLVTMKNGGILSQRTATEVNTISRPDEHERIEREKVEDMEKELIKTERTKQIEAKYSKNKTNNTNNYVV